MKQKKHTIVDCRRSNFIFTVEKEPKEKSFNSFLRDKREMFLIRNGS